MLKIEIPTGLHINNIELVISRYERGCQKNIGYSLPSSYEVPVPPPNIPAEVKMDYSFNTLINSPTPFGEYNLIDEIIGGQEVRDSGVYTGQGGPSGWSTVMTYLPAETLIKNIPIPSSDINVVWLSVYFSNIQEMVEQAEPTHTSSSGQQYTWSVEGQGYHSISVYGYNR